MNPYRHDGRDRARYDTETSLYWLSVRDYDPSLGRFLSHDPLGHLRSMGMIAPYRRGRVRPKTQDGRPLRRFKRRWKVERLFAWLGNFRSLVVRYERYSAHFLGFVHLGCILVLLQ